MNLAEMLAIERPLVGLDLETTSKNPKEARIVEIGIEIIRPDGTLTARRTYVNPGIRIPEEASAKNHVTDGMVADAPAFGSLAEKLRDCLTGCDFAGYNLRYDLEVLACEFARERLDWSREDAKVLDAFRLWQVMMPRTLDDADREFLTDEDRASIGGGESHTALYDTRRSTRILMRQLLRDEKLPRTVAGIHELLNPGAYDAEGKLVLKDGQLALNFGQHSGKLLRDADRGYLIWIKDKGDFSRKVKDAVAAELTRRRNG